MPFSVLINHVSGGNHAYIITSILWNFRLELNWENY